MHLVCLLLVPLCLSVYGGLVCRVGLSERPLVRLYLSIYLSIYMAQGVSEYGWKSDWENRWTLFQTIPGSNRES